MAVTQTDQGTAAIRGIDLLELDGETFAQALRDWIQTYEETPA